MKNFFRVAAVSLILAASAFAQVDFRDSTISIVAYWNKGDSHTYDCIKYSQLVNGNDTLLINSILFKGKITVTDSSSDGYVLKVDYSAIECRGFNEVFAEYLAEFNNSSIIIKTNEFGRPVEVLNWQEILDRNVQSANKLKIKYSARYDLLRAINGMLDNALNKEAITKSSLIEWNELLLFHGLKLPLNAVFSERAKLDTRGEDEGFDSDSETKVLEYDTTEQTTAIKKSIRLDKEQVAAILQKIMEASGNVPQDSTDKPDFTQGKITVTSENYINYNTGWVTTSFYTKEVEFLGQKFVEVMTLNKPENE